MICLVTKKLIVTELFITCRKLNISFFIRQLYFALLKNIRVNSTHSSIMNISKSDVGFQDFLSLYKKFTAKPYSFLVVDITLVSDNPLRFRKKFLERK